jgi:hypothetical protein
MQPLSKMSRFADGVPVGLLASFRNGPAAGFRPMRDDRGDVHAPLRGVHSAWPAAPALAAFVRASTL